MSQKAARRMKRSAEDKESLPPPVIELETQEEIDDFHAAILRFAETVNRDVQNKRGFDPEHFKGIIEKFEESVTDCHKELEGGWFSALVKVGERGKVMTLTNQGTRKVREG